MRDNEHVRNSLHPGHTLHWYKIEKILGQGGFGITYLAYDTNLDQHVAIKEYLPMELAVREGDFSVYPASQSQDARYKWGLDRFLAEARTLARFKHPAIVRVLSVFEANNTAYMVMEYQHGSSLQQLLDRRRTLPEKELVALVIPLLAGLETIHAQGFIHRDIKPSNLFIHTDGHPVLLDFGSARQALGEETRTLTSVVSPGYAPFEQYYSKSDRQGPWTDIYGLGATLYRCLSGLQPMAAIDRSEAILRSERDTFVSASEIGAGQYSASFLAAVDCALLFNETKRPQSIAQWRPYFDFSTTAETFFNASSRGDAPTRFSARIDDTVLLDDRTILNSDLRNNQPSADPQSRRSRAAAGEESGHGSAKREPSPRAVPDAEGRAPLSAPPNARPRTSVLRDVESTRAPNSQPAPVRKTRIALYLTVSLLVAIVAIAGAGYLGLLPSNVFDGDQVARLVVRGDRALAAGQIFAPDKASALTFYRRAYAANPDDLDARHGLLITGERLRDEIVAALDRSDLARANELAVFLEYIPAAVLDLNAVQAQLARAGESNRRSLRVADYLSEAAENVIHGNLVGSGTDNALAKYRAVQILDPGNPAAAAGLTALADALAERGQEALVAGDVNLAQESYQQASLIDASASAVIALDTALKSAQAEAVTRQALNATIAEVLAAAAADIAANRLTSPPGSNALERYQKIQGLEPGNAAARDGIRDIHDRFIAQSRQALKRKEFAKAQQLVEKAQAIAPTSEPARSLLSEIRLNRERSDDEESRRLAIAAERESQQREAQREAVRQAQIDRETERRRQQEEEAQRLLALAEAKAAEERAAVAAEAIAGADAELGRPRIVIDFLGFHPKYARDGITRDVIYRKVAPEIAAAGYEIVTRSEVHDAQYRWTNVKLLAYRLNISENTATGLYSYVGSVNLLDEATLRVAIEDALQASPLWTKNHTGLGPPTDMPGLVDEYIALTRACLSSNPAIRK